MHECSDGHLDARTNRKKKSDKSSKKASPKGGKRSLDLAGLPDQIRALRAQMKQHADALDFEEAAVCRDRARALEREYLNLTGELVVS